MYTQLIIIFIVLGIFAVLHGITLAMLLKLRQGGVGSEKHSEPTKSAAPKPIKKMPYSMNQEPAIVFCKKCSAPFSSKYGVCPKCGTPR